MTARALITGITGQDGVCLAELLQAEGHEVFGLIREETVEKLPGVTYIYGDLRNSASLREAIALSKPAHIYNLGSLSHVGDSFSHTDENKQINFTGAITLLKYALDQNPDVRFYQASTSEIFGDTPGPQTETSPLNPITPYGKAKRDAHLTMLKERATSGAFICCGILYNHESPRRRPGFITRKISLAFARMSLGDGTVLEIGNPDSRRDWGYAKDYVRAMYLMLQQPEPDDYIIATGETHSVRDLVNAAAKAVSLQLTWSGEGVETKAHDQNDVLRVRINESFYRPADPQNLVGNAEKARTKLGWEPTVTFDELITLMVQSDIDQLKTHET